MEVFSEDEEILKGLSQLADPDNNAYIRYKTFESEEIIIHQGDIENTVFWLLKGEARVCSGGKILTHIKPVTCFGEQTVVDVQGRTARWMCLKTKTLKWWKLTGVLPNRITNCWTGSSNCY